MNLNLRISVLQFLKKFQYFIFFSICTVVLLTQIYSCLIKYFSVPTYISSYITDQNKAEIPELTFCKNGPGYKPEVLRQHGIGAAHYAGSKNHTWVSENSTVNPQDIFIEATYSVSDLIQSYYIRTIKADSIGTFGFHIPLERSDPEHLIWKEQRHRGFGRCHSAYP